MALGNPLNQTAQMVVSDDAPIVTDLPIQSDSLSVEQQNDYLKAAADGPPTPTALPGYIPGQRGVEDHDFEHNHKECTDTEMLLEHRPELMVGAATTVEDKIKLNSLAHEKEPATTQAQTALLDSFHYGGVNQALDDLYAEINSDKGVSENKVEKDEEDEVEEEEVDSEMEEVIEHFNDVVDPDHHHVEEGENNCCGSCQC